jgi:hypothetical protein
VAQIFLLSQTTISRTNFKITPHPKRIQNIYNFPAAKADKNKINSFFNRKRLINSKKIVKNKTKKEQS